MNAQFPIASLTSNTILNPLSTRAMLVGLKVSHWSGRRLDKKTTQDVHQRAEAEADAGRYNKLLVPKTSLDPVVKAINDARADHYEVTLPWADEGLRILPAAAYQNYANRLRRRRQEFEAAVEAFVQSYPVLVIDSKKRLGGLYDPNEFPEINRIRDRFRFDYQVRPMPDAQDFRVELATSQVAEIRTEIEASMQEALNFAMKDAWTRIQGTVGKMVERLNAYKPGNGTKDDPTTGRFRDSLVLNIKDLVEVLPAFNLTNDPVMTEATERMRSELLKHDADTLRNNAGARIETAAKAQAILDMVSDYLV